MKKTYAINFVVNLLIILFFYLFLLLITSCKKETHGTAKEPGNNESCTASKASVEQIAIFPADNPWNQDISGHEIDPLNDGIIALFANSTMHPDFGSGTWEGAPIGIPFVAVCGNETKREVRFVDYGDESDVGPYAIPLAAPVEGNGEGDSHVIAVDKENLILYELFNAHVRNNQWEASSGAIFDLKTNQLRTEGWTSADAAGLPIFPGLVRFDEVGKGEIDHALRFTLSSNLVKPSYILPARHKVSSTGGQYGLPFGAKLRLKSSFNISSYPAKVQVILKAMKKYGIILADIGSNLYVSGAPDERWNNDELRALKNLKGSDFEVMKFNN